MRDGSAEALEYGDTVTGGHSCPWKQGGQEQSAANLEGGVSKTPSGVGHLSCPFPSSLYVLQPRGPWAQVEEKELEREKDPP